MKNKINAQANTRDVISALYAPEELETMIDEFMADVAKVNPRGAQYKSGLRITGKNLLSQTTKDVDGLIVKTVLHHIRTRNPVFLEQAEEAVKQETSSAYLSRSLRQLCESQHAHPRELLVLLSSLLHSIGHLGKIAPVMKDILGWMENPLDTGLPMQIGPLPFGKDSPLDEMHELVLREGMAKPEQGEVLLTCLVRKGEGNAEKFMRGVLSVLKKMPLSDKHPWTYGGRLYGLCQQGAEKAIEEVAQSDKKIAAEFFNDPDAHGIAMPIAAFLIPHLVKRGHLEALPQLFPCKLWSGYEEDVTKLYLNLFMGHILSGRYDQAQDTLQKLARYPDYERLRARLLHYSEQFNEAATLFTQYLTKWPDVELSLALCKAAIGNPFQLDLNTDPARLKDLTIVEEYGTESVYLHALIGLMNPTWGNQLISGKIGSLRTGIAAYGGTEDLQHRLLALQWFAALFHGTGDVQELAKLTEELDKAPESLKYLNPQTLADGIKVVLLYPEKTQFLTHFLAKAAPALLDPYLYQAELLGHPAIQERILEMSSTQENSLQKWIGLESLALRALREEKSDIFEEAFEGCLVLAESPQYKPFLLELIARLPEEIPHWNEPEIQALRAESLVSRGKTDESVGMLFTLITREMGSGNRFRARSLLEAAYDYLKPFPPELQKLVEALKDEKAPETKPMVPGQELQVIFLGGSELEGKVTDKLQSIVHPGLPPLKVDFFHNLWSHHPHDIDPLLLKLGKYDIVIVSRWMRTHNGYRIRKRLRELGKPYTRSEARGNESILRDILSATNSYLNPPEDAA